MISDVYESCAAAGYRADGEAGTVDGVCSGVAFRARPAEGTLDLSVNVSEKNLKRWQQTLPEGITAALQERGVRLAGNLPTDLPAFIAAQTAYGAGLADTSFSNKFQTYKEPFIAYLRGVLGAFLGALAGTAVWTLTGFIGFRLWIFGAVISIAAFYGYMWLRGAHNTRFAVTVIVICSLLALAAGQLGSSAILILRASEEPVTFWEAVAICLTPEGLRAVFSSSLFALLACALGFVGIRGKVMDYTHERTWMRRRK